MLSHLLLRFSVSPEAKPPPSYTHSLTLTSDHQTPDHINPQPPPFLSTPVSCRTHAGRSCLHNHSACRAVVLARQSSREAMIEATYARRLFGNRLILVTSLPGNRGVALLAPPSSRESWCGTGRSLASSQRRQPNLGASVQGLTDHQKPRIYHTMILARMGEPGRRPPG